MAESRGIPIRYGLPTPPAIVGPSSLSTAATRHRRRRPQGPPLGWALPDPSTRRRDDGFDPIQYKATTRQQWEDGAGSWDRWGPDLEAWLPTRPARRYRRRVGIRGWTDPERAPMPGEAYLAALLLAEAMANARPLSTPRTATSVITSMTVARLPGEVPGHSLIGLVQAAGEQPGR